MRIREIGEGVLEVRPETRADILSLYFFLSRKRPNLIGEVIWQPKLSRLEGFERGKRVKARVKLGADKIYLSDDISSLRITCRVIESFDYPLRGRTLGVNLSVGDAIVLETERSEIDGYVVTRRIGRGGLIIIVFDDREATLAEVNEEVAVIESKYYGSPADAAGLEVASKVGPLLKRGLKAAEERGLKAVVASSGILLSYLKEKNLEKRAVFIDIGVPGDVTGVLEVLRYRAIISLFKGSVERIRRVALSEDVKSKLMRGEAVYGLEEAASAVRSGRASTVVAVDELLRDLVAQSPDLVDGILTALSRRRGELIVVSRGDELGDLTRALGGVLAFR